MSDPASGRRRAGAPAPEPCPICGQPAAPAFVPFCSARCADIDLGRWLTDRYAIPAAEDEDEDADGSGPPPGRID